MGPRWMLQFAHAPSHPSSGGVAGGRRARGRRAGGCEGGVVLARRSGRRPSAVSGQARLVLCRWPRVWQCEHVGSDRAGARASADLPPVALSTGEAAFAGWLWEAVGLLGAVEGSVGEESSVVVEEAESSSVGSAGGRGAPRGAGPRQVRAGRMRRRRGRLRGGRLGPGRGRADLRRTGWQFASLASLWSAWESVSLGVAGADAAACGVVRGRVGAPESSSLSVGGGAASSMSASWSRSRASLAPSSDVSSAGSWWEEDGSSGCASVPPGQCLFERAGWVRRVSIIRASAGVHARRGPSHRACAAMPALRRISTTRSACV